MATTITAIWVTFPTGNKDYAADLASDVADSIARNLPGVEAFVSDECIVYDDDGNEVFNGEF